MKSIKEAVQKTALFQPPWSPEQFVLRDGVCFWYTFNKSTAVLQKVEKKLCRT